MPVLNEIGMVTPEFFETEVSIAGRSVYYRRYETEDEAMRGHEDVKQAIIDGELHLLRGWLRNSDGISSGELFHDFVRGLLLRDPAEDEDMEEAD